MAESRHFATAWGSVHWEAWGDPGHPPLLLLHNFLSSGRTAWGPMLPALSAHFRVLLPDLPGHGRSQGYPTAFNLGEMARQLADLARSVNGDGGHLAGASGGGMIAQQMVHQGLLTPRTLTLVSTAHSTNPATVGDTVSLEAAAFQAGSRWLTATARLHDPHHYAGYFAQELLPGLADLNRRHAMDLPRVALTRWTLPVCIIHGERDEFFGIQVAESMAAALPDGELHVIPEQPHALLFRRPRRVQEILLDFLRRKGASTSRRPGL